MLNKQALRTSFLTTSLAALLAVTSTALAEEEQASKIFVDPVSGEVIEYRKLISEMSEEEVSTLTEEERAKLEEIEAAVKAKQENEPGY